MSIVTLSSAAARQTAPITDASAPQPADRGYPALSAALDAVGDRWSLLIVAALLERPHRFGDLLQELPGLAPTVLAQRLRRMGDTGLVVATPYTARPVRVIYQLSERGVELAGPVRLLSQWGRGVDGARASRHEACGTPLDARWYCPTCARVVDGPEDGPPLYRV